ncbi:MAG: hypothetical protein Q4C45_06180 [Oscillospiraceae bacterium]|nr:hypothetical protein [Oscillospiraceae bacterium]
MKRAFALLLCGAALLLTACGAGEEAAKDHYYEILNGTGNDSSIVDDAKLVKEIDGLLEGPLEAADDETSGGEPVEPLWIYVCWQEKTLLAGQDPDAEREYEEILRVSVPDTGNELTIQVFPNVDEVDGLSGLAEALNLDGLLTFTVAAPEDTVEELRNAEYFIKNDT